MTVISSLITTEPSAMTIRRSKECVPSASPSMVTWPVAPSCTLLEGMWSPGALEARTTEDTSPATSDVQVTWAAEHRAFPVMSTVSGTSITGSSITGSSITGSSITGSSITGASSSSVVTIGSSTSTTGANSAAEAASTTERVIVEVMSPSSSVSSKPTTVTSWATFQLVVVNVRTVGETDASDGSDAVTLTTTVPVGSVVSTTETVSFEPASETSVVPSVATAVTPAVSSSVVVTSTTAVRAL